VSSLQLEDLISHCRGVKEAAVIGVKDEKWGERPLALVVRDPGSADELTDLAIKAHLKAFADKGIISKYGIPRRSFLSINSPGRASAKSTKKSCARNTPMRERASR
jgi:fatty-acyl-CoA synthase